MEIGDILRYDFTDAIEQLEVTFPKITECFKNSTREDLDNF